MFRGRVGALIVSS